MHGYFCWVVKMLKALFKSCHVPPLSQVPIRNNKDGPLVHFVKIHNILLEIVRGLIPVRKRVKLSHVKRENSP